MAKDSKHTSWHSQKYRHRHPDKVGSVPIPTTPPGPMPRKPVHHRLLDFAEQPLFTLPIGIVGGLVGVFFYAPVLAVCGVCVILAFHRAKVVTGEHIWKAQVPSYVVLCAFVVSSLYGLHVLLRDQVAEANISLSHSLGDYLKQTFGKSHTQVVFLSFSSPDMYGCFPFTRAKL